MNLFTYKPLFRKSYFLEKSSAKTQRKKSRKIRKKLENKSIIFLSNFQKIEINIQILF